MVYCMYLFLFVSFYAHMYRSVQLFGYDMNTDSNQMQKKKNSIVSVICTLKN